MITLQAVLGMKWQGCNESHSLWCQGMQWRAMAIVPDDLNIVPDDFTFPHFKKVCSSLTVPLLFFTVDAILVR